MTTLDASGAPSTKEVRASENQIAPEPISAHYDTRLPNLPWSRRIQIPFIAAAVYSVIRILGPSVALRSSRLAIKRRKTRPRFRQTLHLGLIWHRIIIPIVC